MSRNKAVFRVLIPCVAALLALLCCFFLKQYKIRQAVSMYYDFIGGKISVDGWDIVEISTPTGEPESRYRTDYTIVDVTGDGIPELHIENGREYIIFSVKKGKMYRYSYFQSYLKDYYPLENGKFILRIRERYGYGDYYTYFELNTSGEPINELKFSWIDGNEHYAFDEDGEYLFDGRLCTFEEWYDLTREYLYTDASGTEQIRNAAEWTVYCLYTKSENIATESTDEEREEDIVKQVCERMKSIDYSVQEYPIDTNLYDSQTDMEYKNAFLQALLSRTPIGDNENGEYYIRELREELRYGRSTISEETYIGFLNDLFHFYYLDFDGDGLPELLINGGGHILKYCSDDKQVYDIAPENMGHWDLLCSGKMYYHIESDSAYFIKYGYQEINSSGEVDREVIFEYNFLPDSSTEYLVSIDEFEEVEVGKENWELLTQGLLDAETNAFPHMTFDDLFGDMDIEPLQNDENGLILTDEMYLFEREFDPEARTGGKIEVHYPQIETGDSPELDRQINIIIRDTAFSFFDALEEITYEEALDLIAEETKNSVWDVTIDYPVLHYNNTYISLIFLVESCNGARVNINHYLATIDLTTGQYIHFNDLLNMDELRRLLRNNLFDVYEGTYAEFKEEDAHEPEVIEEFIDTIEKRLNSPDTTQWLYGDVMEHTDANPHYGCDNSQNIALDDKYLYIRFYDSEYYALNDHFILRIPLEYTNIEVTGS